MGKIINRPLLILMVVFLTACGESPTGRKQLTLVPDGQLKAMGIDTFQQLKRSKVVETDPRILRYVQCITQRLIRNLPENQVNWEVRVFRDPIPNAFALPGGKIGVNTGMLRIARTPDQLAAVIGHEIGHVLANHANERLTQQLGVKVVLFLVNLFSDEPGSWQHELLMKGFGLGSKVGVLLPFSRIHESEADFIGMELMAQSGFDPRQSIDLWKNMTKMNQRQPLEFLSTHPSHETRIEKLRAKMDHPYALYNQAVDRGHHYPPCN
jgi:predicted Zn-dependent protease